MMLYLYVGEDGSNAKDQDYFIFNNGTSCSIISYNNQTGYLYAGGGGANTYFSSFSDGAVGGLNGYNGNKTGSNGDLSTGGTQILGGINGLGSNVASNSSVNSL